MANLKDLLVNGPSSLIGDVTVNKIRLTSLEIPTISSGSTYGLGSSGQILKTNGSSVYWANDVVSKLGTATVGSSSQPIYLNNGTPTAITGALANNITGNAATATALATGRTLKVNLASTNASTSFNGTANITDIGVSGILPVSSGGTGKTSLDSNKVLIGDGTSAIKFRNIYSITSHGPMSWLNTTDDKESLISKEALAYWDGSFKQPNDNIIYNITKLGIITHGTWNGNIISVAYGGTGKTSFTGNRLIFSPTSSTFENAQKIYVKNETNADAYMAINKDSITSGYNFEVNGNSSFAGHIETLQHSTYDLGTNSHWWRNVYGEYFSGNAETATAANLTTITNSIAYYSDTIGTFTSTSKIYTNGTKLAIGQNIAPALDSYVLDIEGNVQIVGDLKVNALTPEINSNYTLSLTNSNWTDIESIKGNILTDGTYIIQIYSSFSSSQKAYWSGIFSWTESNDTNIYNEIPLHGVGYLNNSSIYLRTTGKVDIADEGKIKTILQIKANKTISNQSFTIKIKKII